MEKFDWCHNRWRSGARRSAVSGPDWSKFDGIMKFACLIFAVKGQLMSDCGFQRTSKFILDLFTPF